MKDIVPIGIGIRRSPKNIGIPFEMWLKRPTKRSTGTHQNTEFDGSSYRTNLHGDKKAGTTSEVAEAGASLPLTTRYRTITTVWAKYQCAKDKIRVFATYQVLLGWKTYEYCYETEELPEGKPNLRKISFEKKRHLGHFFPTANIFSWVGIYFIRETNRNKPNRTKFSANTVLRRRIGNRQRLHLFLIWNEKN